MHTYMKNREHAVTTLYNLFLSMTNEPICFSSSKTFLVVIYVLIGNRVHVKSLGLARGLANARPLGLTRRANAPQLPEGGGGWAQVELTDALTS